MRPVASTLTPIDPAEPPVEQILAALRRAILSLELAPGTRISESAIAAAVGASRTPVRAALARLGEEGLIATRPSRGNYVTLISASGVREAHFIREALECAIVSRLAEDGLPPEANLRLEGNLAAARRAISDDDPLRFGELDDEFHHLLAETTGHARLVRALVREKALLTRLRRLSRAEGGYMQDLLDEHAGILDAIRRADADTARERLQHHVRRVLSTLDGLQRRNGDYFSRERP